TGTVLVYSTFIGDDRDNAFDTPVAIDDLGNVVLAVSVDLTGRPNVHNLQTSYGTSADTLIAKFDGSGTQVLTGVYLGGAGSIDRVRALALDEMGNVYVTGVTNSTDFPTAHPLQSQFGGGNWDAFVAKMHFASPT